MLQQNKQNKNIKKEKTIEQTKTKQVEVCVSVQSKGSKLSPLSLPPSPTPPHSYVGNKATARVSSIGKTEMEKRNRRKEKKNEGSEQRKEQTEKRSRKGGGGARKQPEKGKKTELQRDSVTA